MIFFIFRALRSGTIYPAWYWLTRSHDDPIPGRRLHVEGPVPPDLLLPRGFPQQDTSCMIPPLTSTNFMVYPTGFLVFHDDHSAGQIYSKRYWASCDTNSELRHPSGTSRTHIDRPYKQFIIGVLLHSPRWLESLTSVLTRFEVPSSWLSSLFCRNMPTLPTFWSQCRTCTTFIPHSI